MPSIILPALAALALPAPQADDANLRVAAQRDAALDDDYAYAITEAITTELGPRLAGTAEEARARKWAVATLTKMGFSNVHDEPFPLRTWVRGTEKAMVVGANSQPLALTALGNSGATPEAGLEGEIVFFPTLDDLKEAPDGSLAGKIAFVSHAMTRTQDGSQYGYYGAVRRQGPAIAAAKGAAAILIRSVGTDSHRMPHAGSTVFPEGTAPIPAAALAIPDAEQLERLIGRGPVRVALTLTPRILGTQTSGNVIAEVPGRDPAAGIVVVACHLDSWDLGTGAIDDAAGCGIVAAAAKRIMDAGRPRRTIRILWAGSEEVGVFGGRAYFEAHKGDNHVLAAESDFGADRIWRLDTNFAPANKPLADRLAAALAPLGISAGREAARGGADVAALISAGVAGVDLQQDGTRYFDLHHTPDDTLDKVDPAQLRQNVAAWTAMLAIVADAPEPISATK
ncbi:peptidase M28 family protein [Sphingomonas spermidinifaciens]|uniref:Carboxypeptidase Q n=1 Tax=Sphingomonas spermidinifaciens TaxID=1141889 RepID=A0A2A4B0N6_9SPHN|nr:M20/M25/M40 family metallo-hydrolase [Sphingomonas spermidinifaciens]PCD01607.1 peptidase M28 family protein [Sphingomonas spermidinifaciens]